MRRCCSDVLGVVEGWRVGLEGDLNSHKKSDPDKDERSKQRHDARIDEYV